MFTNPLPDDNLYHIYIHPYAERHFLKRFEKDYKGKIWFVTLESIKDDLRRVRALEKTQQVDELKHKGVFWLFKYDFAVAKSGISAKRSGNRCVVSLDANTHKIEILLIYGKADLPKNQSETAWILKTVQSEYAGIWERLE